MMAIEAKTLIPMTHGWVHGPRISGPKPTKKTCVFESRPFPVNKFSQERCSLGRVTRKAGSSFSGVSAAITISLVFRNESVSGTTKPPINGS